jgi:hypothetical protein
MSRARWAVASLGVVAIMGPIVVLVGVRGGTAITPVATAAATSGKEWKSHLAAVDRAVAAKDVSGAIRAWRDAYGAALGSRRWEPMFAVGQAALRIGQAAGARAGFDDKASQCYLTALFRARQQNSTDGALLIAEAFADLGDLEVANRAARMAERLAQRARDDRQAPERVAALRHRLDGRSSMVGRGLDPFPVLFPDEMTGP